MASLTSDEYDTILCFAENYSFVVQNAVHSFYWNNSQAIICLSCIIKNNSTHHNIYACTSDHVTLDINAVSTFPYEHSGL